MKPTTKTIIIIAVVVILIYGAYRAYQFSSNPFGSTAEEKTDSSAVTLADIMAKGYDESEARLILNKIEAGIMVNY